MRELDDPNQIMQLLRDFNSSNEELVQVLLNRNRSQPREVAPDRERIAPRVIPEMDTVIDELAAEYSLNAQEFVPELEINLSSEVSIEESPV